MIVFIYLCLITIAIDSVILAVTVTPYFYALTAVTLAMAVIIIVYRRSRLASLPRLEGWQLEQLDGMFEDEENQWGELTIHPDGKMEMEVFFLVDRGGGGYASRGKFLID